MFFGNYWQFSNGSFLSLVKRRDINIFLITLRDVLLSELLTNVLTIFSTNLIGLSISVILQIPRRITFQRLCRGMIDICHLIIPWLLKLETKRTVSLEKQTKRIVSSKGRTVQKTNHACADLEKKIEGSDGFFSLLWRGGGGILLVFL